jgi:hypothetical protein
VTRYVPSRHYLWWGLTALGLGVFSVWFGWNWTPAFLAAGMFAATACLLLCLALLPAVGIDEAFLTIGRRRIPWSDIRRLDRTGWLSPLVVRLTLADGRRVLLVYPGDLDSTNSLLRHLRRSARDAMIDGIPYRQFWGEAAGAAESRALPSPRYRLLRPEDEEEVERLYQRLKSVRHLDPENSADDK